MKLRNKNPVLQDLIKELESRKEPVWKAVAQGLNRPRRAGFEVNMNDIQKHAKVNDNIVVPGTVLGTGEVTGAFIVAALRFTEGAQKKIEGAKGKCLTIGEMMEKNPKKIRIMG
jgi:large subunit ribosomal protein L18e